MAKTQSIVQGDMTKCFICGTTINLHTHHIFGASNRKWSDKYGLVVRLCERHHTGAEGVHFNKPTMMTMHVLGQQAFEKKYSHEEFMKIFGKNYIE